MNKLKLVIRENADEVQNIVERLQAEDIYFRPRCRKNEYYVFGDIIRVCNLMEDAAARYRLEVM